MLLFVIFDEKKNRIGVWFSCNFSCFPAIGTYIVTYGADEKSCCQWCRFSYLWCYCLWCNLVTKSKSSCQWCTLAFGAVTFLPLVLLPLVQFSNQKQEFLPMVHSCLWCCNTGVLLSLFGFVVFTTRRFMLSLVLLCVLVCFQSCLDNIVIMSLGEERDGLCASRAYVCLFCTRQFLSFSSWCQGLTVPCDCGTPWTFFDWPDYSWDESCLPFIAEKQRLIWLNYDQPVFWWSARLLQLSSFLKTNGNKNESKKA